MVADPVLRRDTRAWIERDYVAAEHAVCEVLDGYAARLDALADSYLAARAADVRDIRQRILGIGVVADKTKTLRPANHLGQRAAQLVVVLDDGNGNGHFLKVRSKNAECRTILQ